MLHCSASLRAGDRAFKLAARSFLWSLGSQHLEVVPTGLTLQLGTFWGWGGTEWKQVGGARL